MTLFRIIPASAVLALVVGLVANRVADETLALQTSALTISVTLMLASAYVIVGVLWGKREVKDSERLSPIHDSFKEWLATATLLFAYLFVSLFLLLILLSPDPEFSVTIIGTGVLIATIAFLAIFTRYTAMSFSADMRELIRESKSSNESLVTSFLEGISQLAQGFSENLSAVIKVLEKERIEEREALMKMAEDARRRREEEERLRMMPRLGIKLRYRGLLFHSLIVDVFNRGLSGQSLEVSLTPIGKKSILIPGGDLGAQQRKSFDFGDVSRFPLGADLRVLCAVADLKGRKYTFKADFHYKRTLGPLGLATKSITITPQKYVFPDGRLEE